MPPRPAVKRAATKTAAKPAAAKKKAPTGLTVRTFTGLSKKRMENKGGAFGIRVRFDDAVPVVVQFLGTPDDMAEYDIHSFREDGKWNYVPCLGGDEVCPLCMDEDKTKSKTSYRFVALVYNLKERRVQVLEGPKGLATLIHHRFSRKPSAFLTRTYEITKMPTQPVSYDVTIGDDPTVKTTSLKPIDLQEYILGEAKRYFGDDLPDIKSALDADDDEFEDDDVEDEEDEDLDDEDDDLEDDEDLDEDDDEEDEDEEEDDEDEDDLDEDDEDDEDEEDDEEEDDEPAPVARRKAPVKAAAKKAPVKAPAKKAPAKAAARRR